ncbi:MAG TPA: DUF58 domain-containing protein [Acidimicrobiales bacterium]|nr:DUF58 domain-containing protein [Acidimicrobiales bacterium]
MTTSGDPRVRRPEVATLGVKGIRPRRATGPVLGTVLSLFAWELVARNSGSGWVQALGTILAGVLITGLAGGAVALARVRVRCTAAPADATAGKVAKLEVETSQRVKMRPVLFEGGDRFFGAGNGTLDVVPPGRGVYKAVLVEISSAAPFGIMWWTRRTLLTLPSEMTVGPRMGVATVIPPAHDDRDGQELKRARALVGEPHGVRPYRAGDSRRLVHWPATAHTANTGQLMIRETERPGNAETTLTIRLPDDRDAAERMAENALATVDALLRCGSVVQLATIEADGERVALVPTTRSAARRLARSVTQGGPGFLTLETRTRQR